MGLSRTLQHRATVPETITQKPAASTAGVSIEAFMMTFIPKSNITIGFSLGIFCILLASIAAAAGKHLSQFVVPSTITFFQFAICLLLSLPWLAKNGVGALQTQHLKQHIIRGISGVTCFYAYYVAMGHISLVDATLLRNTAPLFVPIVLLFALKKRIAIYQWVPITIGFSGVAFMLQPSYSGASSWHLVGLLSGAGLAISMVSTRFLATRESGKSIIFYYFLISCVCILPLFIANYEPIDSAAWPWLFYIGLSSYFSIAIYTRAYSYVKASVLAPTTYFAVLFAGIIEWFVWDETPNFLGFLGITLIVAGGLFIVLNTGNSRTKTAPIHQEP